MIMLVFGIPVAKISQFAAKSILTKRSENKRFSKVILILFRIKGSVTEIAIKDRRTIKIKTGHCETVNLTAELFEPPIKTANIKTKGIIEKGVHGRVCSWDFYFCARLFLLPA